ncbi:MULTISPECIES: acyl-CoA desaturase [Xanthomonas]|uniref:Acyl-CoA desaturase n=1 Tax=Xanthomonas indica TaxID=2912242 RepID=A0AAU8IAE9_9XANT|nr:MULTISPECIES: acyl-CoA desaturase [Xanthomonas]MCI2260129.1 acyl-CoA desaturase [Xanthomonas indica]UYC10912.1 acyl-CoA desaturase [Xanthomonas sp. CFBP 8445]
MPSPVPERPHSTTPPAPRGRILRTLRRWFDTSAEIELDPARADRIDWLRAAPYIGLHLACLGVFWVGVSWFAVGMAVAMYAVRMFALTGFYHRYFAHRAFKTSRPVQFLFAAIGATCVQRGPLWWAAHHRNHHRHTDTPADPHSPRQHGFWWSHSGWFLTPRGFRTDWDAIPDLRRFPELRFLDRFDLLLPVLLALALFLLGEWLQQHVPQLGTDGPQLLVWGFFVSTVALFHATFTINSLAHRFGSRRFDTRDDSRNNLWLALLTFGEGWHNNHHFFPGAARQGFRWWELDLTWYGLKALSWTRVIRELKPVPAGLLRAQARAR